MSPKTLPAETAPTATPPNIFTPEFRRQKMAADDEPDTAAEAETAGAWKVVPAGELGYAVLRLHESLEQGDRPYATFLDAHLARYAAAVLPFIGREPAYRLATERAGEGHPVLLEGRRVGSLQIFDEKLLGALNTVDGLARLPPSLALLLEATSSQGIELAGRILAVYGR